MISHSVKKPIDEPSSQSITVAITVIGRQKSEFMKGSRRILLLLFIIVLVLDLPECGRASRAVDIVVSVSSMLDPMTTMEQIRQ